MMDGRSIMQNTAIFNHMCPSCGIFQKCNLDQAAAYSCGCTNETRELESENARLKEAVEVMRKALEYQRRAWQWYVTGCQIVSESGEMVKLASNGATTGMADIHKESARSALLSVDALLKSEESK